jgi:hypothetical protein
MACSIAKARAHGISRVTASERLVFARLVEGDAGATGLVTVLR